MSRLDTYRERFSNAQLTRNESGVLEVTFHTDGGCFIFNGNMDGQFIDLFHEIAADPGNRVVILTGSGDTFMEPIDPEGFDFFTPQGHEKILREAREVIASLLDVQIPVIAAVNGPVRLHSELVLLSDVVLATPAAVFQEKLHFGFGPATVDGPGLLWPEVIGVMRARYFILTGQEIDAETALAWGAVNEVVPEEQLLLRAHEIAARIVSLPPLASRHTRIAFTERSRRLINRESGQSACASAGALHA
jgi:enoyl-CoA hydratase/carnithine racemase